MVMTGRELLRPRSSKPSEASEIQSAKAELVRFLSGSRGRSFLSMPGGGPKGNYAGLCSLKKIEKNLTFPNPSCKNTIRP